MLSPAQRLAEHAVCLDDHAEQLQLCERRRNVTGAQTDSPCELVGSDWTIGHPVLFPNILAQGNADRMSFQLRVPVDDTHTHDVIIDATNGMLLSSIPNLDPHLLTSAEAARQRLLGRRMGRAS